MRMVAQPRAADENTVLNFSFSRCWGAQLCWQAFGVQGPEGCNQMQRIIELLCLRWGRFHIFDRSRLSNTAGAIKGSLCCIVLGR